MKSRTRLAVRSAVGRVALIALIAGATANHSSALQSQRAAPPGYITGVVRSSQGPEAGVWVIAETKELPTNFIKIVVTDDQGRFMVPELPAANYGVWVRGYGLVDSTPVTMKPAHQLGHADGDRRQDAARGGEGLSGQLLAVDARAAGRERISRHRQRRATASGRTC